jgi:RNA polymerase sigma factor (sigma-70 family)
MKDAVNKSFENAAYWYWRKSVTGKRARKEFEERLKANLGNLSLYCQPPKPYENGTYDLYEALKQWTWWPDFFQLLRIEDDALTLALSERKFPSRRIWKAFELVNRRHRKTELLKHINDLVRRATERFRESGVPKLEGMSWEQERDKGKAIQSYARASKLVRDDAEPSSWRGGSGALVRWLLKIGYPDMDELKAFNPWLVLTARLDELNKEELERKAKQERLEQSATPITRTREDAEDVRLMGLVIRGDMKAFAELRKRHQWGVYRFVWGQMKGPHEQPRSGKGEAFVDDITQSVFIQVWREARRYVPAPNAKFTTWLLEIAKNLTTNERKRAASAKERSEFDHFSKTGSRGGKASQSGFLLRPVLDFSTSPGTTEADSDSGRLQEALSQLPEKQRRIIEARFGLGCDKRSRQELADELGITASKVEQLEQEALDQLRPYMI